MQVPVGLPGEVRKTSLGGDGDSIALRIGCISGVKRPASTTSGTLTIATSFIAAQTEYIPYVGGVTARSARRF